MCNRSGVKLVNLRDAGFVETICNGHFLKKVYLSKDVLDADVIINLPKLKTHSLCILTCGIKNLYGIIPQGHRSKYHSEYARNEYFSQVLTDIFSIAMPQLTIVDGIIAMEGEGPAAGSLRKLGIVLASQDTVAIDAVVTNIMGLNPTDIYTTLYSDGRGLGEGTLENIEIVGEELEGVVVPDFKPPSSAVNTLSRRLNRALPKFIIRQLSLKPNVITSRCTGCSECEKICPVGAAKVSGKKAQINHSICVQCMCCHEVCRFNAIQLKRSMTGTLINFVIKMAKRLL